MILGLGTDILFVPRLHRLLSRHPNGPLRLAKRILSPSELDIFHAKYPDLGEFTLQNGVKRRSVGESRWGVGEDTMVTALGVSWCIKEAAYKAIFPRWKLSWKDLTVTRTNGLPADIALQCGIQSSHVSVSHDGDYIIAQILFEGEDTLFGEDIPVVEEDKVRHRLEEEEP